MRYVFAVIALLFVGFYSQAGEPTKPKPKAAEQAGNPWRWTDEEGGYWWRWKLDANDALDAANAERAARGLRPYLRDNGLAQAALACARFRALHGIHGHTSNDFGFLPEGAQSPCAGCAAWQPGTGFGACALYENWTYAGAATVIGVDGLAYHHLFVR